jgi:hypothetical protein
MARERLDKLEAMARENGIDLNTYISNQRIFNRAFAQRYPLSQPRLREEP